MNTMRRLLAIVVAVIFVISAMLFFLNGATSSVAAASEDEEPKPLPSGIELEMLESGGNVNRPLQTTGDLNASANLTASYVMPNYATVDDLIPRVMITKGADTLAEGYFFVAPFPASSPSAKRALMIVNDKAQLVYYQDLLTSNAYDFKRLSDGTLSYISDDVGGFNILDSSYSVLDTWYSGPGYPTIDVHELELLANGNVAFMIYNSRTADLSAFGGQVDAEVIDLVIQEMDQDHNVVFTWDSRDHFAITDTYVSLTQDLVDYSHGNAIDEDIDGNFLISSRHMSEITKIDRETGEIIWRLGGKNNEFVFVNETTLPDIGGFSYQHDIRRLPNGNISLFDNSNQFINAGLRGSRGVEYEINEMSKIVTMTQEFRTTPDTLAGFMGSMQRQPNGNTVVGWGGGFPPSRIQPVAVREFTPEGDVALELGFLDTFYVSYRGFKFPWQGFPTTDPTLIAVTDSGDNSLYYSWNGATEVVSYTVLGGQTPQDLVTIAQQPKTDFEESTSLEEIGSDICFFQVIPAMANNALSRPSSILYIDDTNCSQGLTADNSQITSRAFPFTQPAGNVTSTLTLLPGGFTTTTLFIHSMNLVEAANVPPGLFMSDVRFSLTAYEGESFSETSVISGETQLTIEYGALAASRNPADVNLLRWDEATQSWTTVGFTLLEREVVGESVTYALHRTGTFALFVSNQLPESDQVDLLTDEDASIGLSAGQIPFFDVDGDLLTGFVVETLPVSGSLTFSGTPVIASQAFTLEELPLLRFTPAANEFGLPYTSFEFSVSDGFTQSIPYSLTILVRPVNDAPVALDDQVALLTDEDESIGLSAGQIPYFDVDGDPLADFVVETLPISGSLTFSGTPVITSQEFSFEDLPLLRFTPAANEFGLPYASFEFSVSDGLTPRLSYSLTVSVNPVNDAPVALDDQALFVDPTAATLLIDVLANDSDVDGDTLSIVSVANPVHGTVEISGTTVSYTATLPYQRSDSFTYTMSDGNGEESTATVSVQRSAHVQRLPRIGAE